MIKTTRQIKTAQDIKQLGTILCVWAHPDDESFTCAGIMTTAIKNGQSVACLTATKGEAGVQDERRWPSDKLGDIRAQEMKEALKHIGCTNHHWLGYRDGQCHEVPITEAASRIITAIKEHKPDTILTFGPDGLTGHTDHQSVSRWVTEATRGSDIKVFHAVEEEERYLKYMVNADKQFDIYFNIDKPPVIKATDCDIAYTLPPDVLFQKRLALKAMPSQTERMFKQTPTDMMNAMLGQEFFILAKKHN